MGAGQTLYGNSEENFKEKKIDYFVQGRQANKRRGKKRELEHRTEIEHINLHCLKSESLITSLKIVLGQFTIFVLKEDKEKDML